MGNFDFTGFQFGDWKSHDKKTGAVTVLRVSSGDRYNETLHPEVRDKVVEVPGMDGSYYFGSDYGSKQIDIDIAFDHLTEEQFRTIRKVFGSREIQKLIFDETPYKYYLAKIANPIELSFVCFDEPVKTIGTTRVEGGLRVVDREFTQDNNFYASTDALEVSFDMSVFITQLSEDGIYEFIYKSIDEETFGWFYYDELVDLSNYGISYTGEAQENDIITIELFTVLADITREDITPYVIDYNHIQRVYKGEGKINFICYFPFAKSNFKVLPDSAHEFYQGSEDWAFSSGIISQDLRDLYRIDIGDTITSVSVSPTGQGFNITDEEVFKNRVRHTGVFKFTFLEEGDEHNWYYTENSYPINLADFGITCISPVSNSTFNVQYTEAGLINVYNAGDLPTGFCLYLSQNSLNDGLKILYTPYIGADFITKMVINPITIKPYQYVVIDNPTGNPKTKGYYELINKKYILTNDTTVNLNKNYYEQLTDIGILIDSNIGLIQGVKEIKNSGDLYDSNSSIITSGTIYNEYIDSGVFFKLEQNQLYNDGAQIKLVNLHDQPIASGDIRIFYQYLYF